MRCSIDPRNTKRLERHALRVQHPNDVVIRRDDERGRIYKRIVVRKNCGINVPVRRNDRQRTRLIVQRARVTPDCRIGIEVAILVKVRHTDGFHRESYSRDQSFRAASS